MQVLGRSVNGGQPVVYDDNFDENTALSGQDAVSPLSIPSTLTVNGETLTYNSMAIDANGLVLAKYGNQTFVMGKVGVATFNNPEGLEKSAATTISKPATQGIRSLQDLATMAQERCKQVPWKCPMSIFRQNLPK